MNGVNGIRLKRPVHPGVFIKDEIVDALNLTVTDAAEALGVKRQTLSNLLNSHSSLTADMAIRIEKAFGIMMETLMRMQNSYDIAEARDKAGKIIVRRYKSSTENKTGRANKAGAFVVAKKVQVPTKRS